MYGDTMPMSLMQTIMGIKGPSIPILSPSTQLHALAVAAVRLGLPDAAVIASKMAEALKLGETHVVLYGEVKEGEG